MGDFHDIGGARARFEFTFMIPDMLLVMFTIFGVGFSTKYLLESIIFGVCDFLGRRHFVHGRMIL